MRQTVKLNHFSIGNPHPLVLIAGPCVIETYDIAINIAESLKKITDELGMPFIFKASYDKANRTSIHSFRGPGRTDGLRILEQIKTRLDIPVISDVHSVEDVAPAADVLDVIQIPAFLCRQTDLIIAVAQTGKIVNIKKGQFLAPWDMTNTTEKAASTGNRNIIIMERGNMFGYNNLVVDFRGIRIMQEKTGFPVIFDATHSVQLPGGSGTSSGGQREYAPVLARAAVAAGADGVFMEVHTDPDNALCDGPNSLGLDTVKDLLVSLQAIREVM